ncbi:MAG: biotin/lipoyl-binding protein, partial [Minisyncoccia bacterium]
MKITTLMMKIKLFITTKKILYTLLALFLLFLGWYFFIREPVNKSIQTAIVTRKSIAKTVLTTGQVVSSTDLSLSFQSGGVVRRINIKEGDVVRQGAVLAVLDQGTVGASLESARGALSQAKANLEKIKSGATTQDVAVSQAAVDSAKATLDNAKQTLINQLNKSYSDSYTQVISATNILFSNPQSNFPQFGVANTVQTNAQAVSTANNNRVEINSILANWSLKLNAISDSNIDELTADSLAYLQKVSSYMSNIINILNTYTQITTSGAQTAVTAYVTSVASAKATVDTSYTTLTSNYQAIKSANYALAQVNASLALKQTGARVEDISIAEAQVES